MPWTTEEKTFIVETYFRLKSIHAAQLQFKERLGCREFPVHSMIYRRVNKFTACKFTEVHSLGRHIQAWRHWAILVRGRQRAVCDNQHRAVCPGAWQVLDSTWSTERDRQGPPVVPAGWCYPPHLKGIIGMVTAAFP